MGNGRNLGGYGGGGDYITEIEPSDEIIPGGFTTVVVLSSVGQGETQSREMFKYVEW